MQVRQIPSPLRTFPGAGVQSWPAAQRTRCGVMFPSHAGSTRVAPNSASRARNAASACCGSFPAQVRQIPCPRFTSAGRGVQAWFATHRTRWEACAPSQVGSSRVAPSFVSRARNSASATRVSSPAQVRQIPAPFRTFPGRGVQSWPAAHRTRWGAPTPSHEGSSRVAPNSSSRARNAASATRGSRPAQVTHTPLPFRTVAGIGVQSCPAAHRTRCGVFAPSHKGSSRVAPSSANRARNAASACLEDTRDLGPGIGRAGLDTDGPPRVTGCGFYRAVGDRRRAKARPRGGVAGPEWGTGDGVRG